MRSDHPGDDRPVDSYGHGRGYGDGYRDGYSRRDRYGQPTTDAELLRQFGRAYDEHVRRTRPLVMPEGSREPSTRERLWALLALVALVLLLVVAIVVGSLLMGPR